MSKWNKVRKRNDRRVSKIGREKTYINAVLVSDFIFILFVREATDPAASPLFVSSTQDQTPRECGVHWGPVLWLVLMVRTDLKAI